MAGLSLITLQPKPADPQRAALADALQVMEDAFAAVENHKAAIGRARLQVRAGEKAIKAAEEGVTKAQREYAGALADAAATDTPAPTSNIRVARQVVVDRTDELEAARLAFAQLKADLPGWENTAREAAITVEATISAILAVSALQLIERANEIARQLAPVRDALAALWSEKPSGAADYLAHERGHAPLVEAKAAAAVFFQTVKIIDDKHADIWLVARERLRSDPYAELPDFAPPPPEAAA
jgi:hypothetical protein